MKIFEFLFNPCLKPDSSLIFDSFCYEPASSQEKKLGSLYIVAELKNALPENSRLVQNLALLLKREYYLGSSSEPALKKALKKANDFLADRMKLGNVSWLGNLSLAILSFADFQLNFSKEGDVKIFLLRPGQVLDIGKNFEIEEFEPYPLKVFTNIVGGRFLENDKILILTKTVYEFFLKNNLLAKVSSTLQEKDLKDLFKNKEKELAEIKGACLLLTLTKGTLPKSQLTIKKTPSPFSLKDLFSPILKKIKLSHFRGAQEATHFRGARSATHFEKLSFSLPKISFKSFFKIPRFSVNINLPRINLGKISFPKPDFRFNWKSEIARKNLVLILSFVLVLALGFFASQKEKGAKETAMRSQLIEAQEKTVLARGYLTLGQQGKADSLLREVYQQILPLVQDSGPVNKDAKKLKETVEKELTKLNKMEEIPEPKLIFSFDSAGDAGFSPQQLTILGENIYFSSPYEKGLAKLTKDNSLEKIVLDQGFSFAAAGEDSLFLFSRPDKISVFKDNKTENSFSLELPGQKTVFFAMDYFRQGLYFLEKDTGKIFKYRLAEGDFKNYNPWLMPGEKKAVNAKSIGVMGSVYILNEDNSIWEYRGGRFFRTIDLSFFPLPKKLAKIVTTPYLANFAILEPLQERIVILDRSGSLIKQFRSPKFNNIKDAGFSSDGKYLYILSGMNVYRISL